VHRETNTMHFSSAVQWWEEWQLHILILGSLGIQCYLAFLASERKNQNRPLFRFSIWLAFLGGEAVAMYALLALFNRQSKLRYTSANGNQHDLVVLWAPICWIFIMCGFQYLLLQLFITSRGK
jgi:hypothetical protein